MTRALMLLVALSLLLAPLGACSSDSAARKPPAQRLSAAQNSLDKAPGVRIALSTQRLPAGVNGVLRAKGLGTKAPAFKGDITVMTGGISATLPVVAVHRKVYVDFGGWKQIKPRDFGAPDPADLVGRGGGLSSLLTEVDSPKAGADTRRGDQVLSMVTGTLPGSKVQAIIPQASADDFHAVFLLNDHDRLAQAEITGPFYPRTKDVTYTIVFSHYGATERIAAPRA